jgi:exopolyphosphatase / guanosine-5'-triphosphate,3'-diphosphate pyrophosphatase
MYMGCVTYTREYFSEGILTREHFRAAETAAGLELRSIETQLRGVGWQVAVGASGTINAIADILRAQPGATGEITLPAMKKIRKACIGSVRNRRAHAP